MKTVQMLILAILALVCLSFAGTQFEAAAGENIEMQVYSKVAPKSGMVDTLGAASDSVALWSLQTFEPGWIYLVKNGLITGGGSDSVKFVYRVDVYNASKTHIGRYFSSDTVSDSTGSTIELPIGRKVIGNYYTIKAVAATGNGGEVILNNLSIDRARYVSLNK